ncbi:MAG: hypothetical protein OHK0029_42490 [Armatimonadaceae bacterium]
MNRTFLIGAVAAAVAIPAFAAGVTSGLKPGQSVSPFHPKHLAGPLAGTDKCFPCTFQNRPQVQVWVNGDDAKNVTTIASNLSKAMKTHSDKEFKALVVFLTTPQNATKTEALVKAAAKMPETKGVGMAILDSKDEAVSNYKVNTSADVKNTVFVYKDWKVANTFVNLKADNKGIGELNQAITGITK